MQRDANAIWVEEKRDDPNGKRSTRLALCSRPMGGLWTEKIEETEANTRLIASAPDMYDALIAARQVLQTAERYYPDTFHLLNVQNAVEKALAQAEGRTA